MGDNYPTLGFLVYSTVDSKLSNFGYVHITEFYQGIRGMDYFHFQKS